MANKKSEMKLFRAIVTTEFEASSREEALQRAKEQYGAHNSKVRVQEATTAWLTIPDTAPTAS